MIIQRPITAARDPNNRYRTVLHFERGENIPFYMRGAISWPELEQQGFVLMAGQNIETGIVYIFEQEWFWTVPIWTNPDGTLRKNDTGGYHLGLIQFIKDWEALYKCAAYFYGGQHPDLTRRYGIELYRNDLTPKNISLIEAPYVKEVGDDLVFEKMRSQKFMGQWESHLHKSLEKWKSLRSAGIGGNGAIHSLRALFAGLEAYPFVKMEMTI